MASTPRMIPLAIIFLLLALIAIIAERNPSQPGDEPAFTKVQEVAAGDTLHLEGESLSVWSSPVFSTASCLLAQ